MGSNKIEQHTEKKVKKGVHSYLIIFIIIIACALLTYVIPAGTFERVYDEALNRNLVVASSYTQLESNNPCGPFELFTSIFSGYVSAADLLFFVMFAVAYTNYLTETKTLDALVGWIRKKLGSKEHLIIPIFIVIFSLTGSVLGLYEEIYGLIPPFIAIAFSLGYDRIVGGGIVYLGMATGFAAAILNPFTIGVASPIAEIPLVSGTMTLFRIVIWFVFTAITTTYIIAYARKIKKDPSKSLMAGLDDQFGENDGTLAALQVEFNTQHKLSLLILILLTAMIGVGTMKWDFYLVELASLFFIAYILTALVHRLSFGEICDKFVDGAKSSIFAVLLIGLTRSISVILTNASIIDTIVNSMTAVVQTLPPWLYGIAMLFVQTLINFFIPSGSGQAIVTMPIMVPMSDLLGIAREVTVTAFQFGDGFSNIIWPTMSVAGCAIMRIPLSKWYRFVGPLYGIMLAVQCIFIFIAQGVF